MRSAIRGALLGGIMLATCGLTDAERDAPLANNLYGKAVNQGVRASELERRGKKKEAIDAYEIAGQLSEAALTEAEQASSPLEGRPPEVYYRCATSYLHAGRLLSQIGKDGDRKDENLRRAVTYLDMVDQIELARAQQTNTPINPEVWRVRNAAGYASFLRGKFAQARLHYQAVLEMNPTYKPAEQAIAEINKLEQQENELFTPQGRTLQKEKDRKAISEVVKTLRLVRDIVTLGR